MKLIRRDEETKAHGPDDLTALCGKIKCGLERIEKHALVEIEDAKRWTVEELVLITELLEPMVQHIEAVGGNVRFCRACNEKEKV